MRFVCRVLIFLSLVGVLAVLPLSPARALEVTPPPDEPAKTSSPVIVTGYAFSQARLYYIQLFNDGDTVVDLAGWRLEYDIAGGSTVKLTTLDGLLKPKGYIVIGDSSALPGADSSYTLAIPAGVVGAVSALRLIPPTVYTSTSLAVKTDASHNHWKRNISEATGNYLSTFTAFTPDAPFRLYGKGFYDYPPTTLLQITEVLANPRGCSPLDTSGDCFDFIELHNPSLEPIDLSQFRLRTGFVGQSATSSNTYALAGALQPGQTVAIHRSADDRPLSITNSGGFAWLEDMYGIKRYDNTVTEYADASADSKKGQAWAYDTSDGLWKWTALPTPDQANQFPVVVEKPKAVASTTPTPCKAGQYRSEETGRCRSLASDVTALAPCDDDQERNPATGRCRKLATLASQTLAPCKEGQERNPATNRCRNVAATSPPDAAFKVEPLQETGKAFAGWWALGGVGMVALGYGAWEWRREVADILAKAGSFFTARTP